MIKSLKKEVGVLMDILGLDRNDPNLQDTPRRISKMLVNEMFFGLYHPAPKCTVFPNTEKYNEMVKTTFSEWSTCSHHFVPFECQVKIAYIPNKKVIGLSKIPRVFKWYSRRPQLQENLTKQVADHLQDVLGTKDVAVHIRGRHLCAVMRGIEKSDIWFTTTDLRGKFRRGAVRQEFFQGD